MGMQIGKPSIDTNGLVLYFDGTNPYQYAEIPGVGTRWLDPYRKNEGMLSYNPTPSFDNNYNCMVFNGWSDYLNITGRPDLYLNDTGYSINCWIYQAAGGYPTRNRVVINIPGCGLIYIWASSYYNQFLYDDTNGRHFADRYRVSPRSWTMLTVNAYKTGPNTLTVQQFVNGSYLTQESTSTFSNYSNRNITISDPGNPFSGHIGMIAMYNRSLTGNEILKLYNTTKNNFKTPSSSSVVTDGLVLHLDAANQNSYTSGSNMWYDLSGRNNHATLVGSPLPSYDSSGGGSISFDGINYAQIAHSSDIDLYENSYLKKYTIFLTTMFTTPNYSNTVLYKGSQYIVTYTNNDNLYGTLGNTQYYQGISNNYWYDFCFYYNGYKRVIYAGAATYGETNGTVGSIITDTSNLIIAPLKCNVARVLFYNRALSMAEVVQNYNAIYNRIS